ncbi:hypothetical protein AX16_004154 [Volvariella volvacea WC 439]|nr:hypothetical protein AX16_004154 [Volvariella volvacea WC 439]
MVDDPSQNHHLSTKTHRWSNSDGLELRLRIFHPKDADQVRSLFVLAMSTAPDSPLNTARKWYLFRAPESLICYAIILTSIIVFLFTPRAYATIRSASVLAGILALRRFLNSKWTGDRSLAQFVQECLEGDLADIAKHYKLRPRNPTPTEGDNWGEEEYVPSNSAKCFWVVEANQKRKSGGAENSEPEIVGTIALDVHYTAHTNQPYGE